ncbi:MAG: preprotein translocase subunit SecE [Legionellales bacterium]|nr:preprotein translocase subunit SecE [Legionellales bacterium]
MSEKRHANQENSWVDLLLWTFIVCIVLGGSYAMYLFREQISVFRLLITFCGMMVVLSIASQTSAGSRVVRFSSAAWVEMAKVTWPKPTEARHISIVVVCAVTLITLMMWLVDSLLTIIVRNLLG